MNDKESTQAAHEFVKQWLRDITKRWDAALTTKPPRLEDVEDMPAIPGDISLRAFMDAVLEICEPNIESGETVTLEPVGCGRIVLDRGEYESNEQFANRVQAVMDLYPDYKDVTVQPLTESEPARDGN